MSRSVDILIKADDQASQKVVDAAVAVDKSLKRVEQITKSLETPTEKYTQQLKDMEDAYNAGIITAEQFADAEEKLTAKLTAISEAAEEQSAKLAGIGDAAEVSAEKLSTLGDSADKSATKLKGTTTILAGIMTQAGGSELATVTRQFGDLSDKVSGFNEAAKSGAGNTAAMKVGLIGLAATIGFSIGKMLADVIWQTEAWERKLQKAKDQAKELDDQLKKLNATMFANTKEDIELIRNPEEKRAAYKQLMEDLDRDIQIVSANVRKSQKDVDAWADAWKITGDRKQYEQDAIAQLQLDKERLEALKDQREEIEKIAGARALENEQIRLSNEAKDKSADYLQSLRDEVEYLKATREEQIKLDAARNTTAEDRGEAERLLKERDAIIAKKEAAEELERAQKHAAEEAARAAKEAAEEEAREAAKLKAKEAEDKIVSKGHPAENLQASESRLLTRGSGFDPMDQTNRILRDTQAVLSTVVTIGNMQLDAQKMLVTNTMDTLQVKGPL